jgi:hypothetical protein
MINKKILSCFSTLCAFYVLSSPFFVSAQTVIPSSAPSLIEEESNNSGKLDSFLENQSNKFSNYDITNSGSSNSSSNSGDNLANEGLMSTEDILGTSSNVTLESFGGTIVSRIIDVLELMQKISKPFLIIMFILSALTSLISLVFGGKNFKNGLAGMAFSIIAYVGIMYAPDLVIFFATWLSA